MGFNRLRCSSISACCFFGQALDRSTEQVLAAGNLRNSTDTVSRWMLCGATSFRRRRLLAQGQSDAPSCTTLTELFFFFEFELFLEAETIMKLVVCRDERKVRH